MEEKPSILQRYGGHLVLLLIGALLFIGFQLAPTGALLDFTMAEEPPTGPESAPVASDETGGPADAAAQPVAADLSNVPVRVNYSLSPALNPITFQGKRPEHDLVTYTVEPNDTPIGIAEKFGIRSETLLGGNPALSQESSSLQAGDTLIILPIDGVLHDVVEGDSLESVANQYGVPVEDIIAYGPNNLEFPFRLYPGTQIMVPGAVREVFVWTAPQLPTRPRSGDSTGSGIAPLVQGTGTFVWPVGARRITQVYWYGHQAIDIGVAEGSAVVASDTGTVTWAGWNVYGYGNLIVVNHGNGYETYYAHLSSVGVVPGQVVYQGQYIGASGNTGRSSGPHLHFEIRYFNSLLEPMSMLGG